MITADRGFIQSLGPDFGFWLLGSSDPFVDLIEPFGSVLLISTESYGISHKFALFSLIYKILFRYRHSLHRYFVELIVILNAKTHNITQGNSNS